MSNKYELLHSRGVIILQSRKNSAMAGRAGDDPALHGRPDDEKSYPVASENDDEPLGKQVHIPIFHPDLNNLGVDELITKSFADILQLKFDSGEWGATVGNDLSDFTKMKACMSKAYFWGTATAITQFAFLRWAGARTMNRSIHKGFFWPWRLLLPRDEMLQQARREKSPWHHRIVTLKDGRTKFEEARVSKPITMAMDAGVSLLSGCLVGFVTVDKQKLYNAAAEIPLKEGRSPVSEVLCEDFLKQDDKIPQELWEEHNDDAMRALRKFLDNCQKRSLYEQQLRRESLLSPEEPVSIPLPGVPQDFEIPDESDVHGKGVSVAKVPSAWSPEDYNLWDEDSEDDWSVDDGSD